jgi:hypothetical protein
VKLSSEAGVAELDPLDEADELPILIPELSTRALAARAARRGFSLPPQSFSVRQLLLRTKVILDAETADPRPACSSISFISRSSFSCLVSFFTCTDPDEDCESEETGMLTVGWSDELDDEPTGAAVVIGRGRETGGGDWAGVYVPNASSPLSSEGIDGSATEFECKGGVREAGPLP